MSNFIQEIKNHNINKVLNLEMAFRTSDEDFNKSIDEVADTLNKSFLDGLVDEQAVEIDFKNLDIILEKARPHKYYKREGSPGNYKYYYTKEEYEKEKKKVEGGKEGLRINESQRKTVENKPVGSTHEHNGKKYKKQANGKWVEVSEHGMTKKEHEESSNQRMSYGSHPLMSERIDASNKMHQEAASKLSDKEYTDTDFEEKEERQTYKKGDKIEFNGVTIHVGKDTSGGQDTLTYKSPDISDKTFYDLYKLKEKILEKTPQSSPKKPGDIIEHNGKKYKKQANGKWLEVSEFHGLTKKEHEFQSDVKKESASLAAKDKKYFTRDTKLESAKLHSEQASKLSDKEHSDEEVMGGEKKYTNKDLEGYGDYKIQDHKDSIQSHIDDIKSGKDKEHNLKFIEIHKELLKRKTPDFKDAPHHQENLKKYLTEVDNKLESAKLHSEDKPLKAKDYKVGDKIIYTHKGRDYPGTVKDEFDDGGIFIILDKAVWVEKEKEKGVANPMGYNNTEEPIRSFELYDGEEYRGLTINNLRKVK